MPTFVRTFIGASVLLLMTVQGANAQTLTLESALQTAFANNPDMAAAQREIDIAQGAPGPGWLPPGTFCRR